MAQGRAVWLGVPEEGLLETSASVGIEVAIARMAGAVRPSGEPGVTATATDAASLDADDWVGRWQALQPDLIVLEATGGREGPVVAAVAAAGLPVAVCRQPPSGASLCAGAGPIGQDDWAGRPGAGPVRPARSPRPRPLPDADAQAQELRALLARRRQLRDLLSAERQRLDTALPAVQTPSQRHLAWLEQEMADLDHPLAERGPASPLWREREHLLRRVPGSGPTTHRLDRAGGAARMGRLDRQALATLVGAPLSGESGPWRGRRVGWGGRARVRTALSMATLVASRHHPSMPLALPVCAPPASRRK